MGRDLHSRVKSFFENPPGPASTPLELLLATLDDLEKKVQPAGRGARVFPYNRVMVHIRQPDADRAAIEAVFRQLETRLRERLAELRCHGANKIETEVLFAPGAVDGEPVLAVECFNDVQAPVESSADTTYPTLRVTVVKGKCCEAEYTFAEPVIAIGRTVEPVDALGRIRRNHVAFLETRDGVTETVGRAHARLQFDTETAAYHLFTKRQQPDVRPRPVAASRAARSARVARAIRRRSADGSRGHPADDRLILLMRNVIE
jgi:hypothetical protein